ncbi:MAG: hypothetical protein ACOYKE_06595 [Ferruginibacter sp.]
MQRIFKISLFMLLITAVVVSSGCSASRKNQCGCPNKKGMVGY